MMTHSIANSNNTYLKTPSDFVITKDVANCAEDIRKIFARTAEGCKLNEVEVLGLEIRRAYAEAIKVRHPDNLEYYTRKCLSLLSRPAIEVGILSYWADIVGQGLSREGARGLAGITVGHPVSVSKWAMTIPSNDVRIVFEDPEIAQNWISDIYRLRDRGVPLHLLAIFAYTRTMLAHTFSDGNGRLARIIFQVFMSESIGWQVPGIALAPASYKNMTALQSALKDVGTTGNWTAIAIVLKKIVIEASRNA